MTFKSFVGVAGFALVVGASPSVKAGQWIGYSGANFSQVVVAGGLAFATVVGAFNNSTGQFPEYNQNIEAFTSIQGSTPLGACIGPAFGGSAYGLFTGNNHIESMAATTRYTMQSGTPPSGYFELWVIATNGNTYRTWGNAACASSPNDSNVPVPWQLVAGVTPAGGGTNLAPMRISVYHTPAPAGMHIDMVDYYNNLWGLSVTGTTGSWSNPQYNNTNTPMFYFGDSSDGKVQRVLGDTRLYAFCPACNTNAPLPSLPSGIQLALTSSNFYKVGFTQPITHTASTVWAVTTAGSASDNQNIMQSVLSGGTWSAWQTYPTGQFQSANDPIEPLPWSIVDASSYRGILGDLFVIGSYYRLYEYLP